MSVRFIYRKVLLLKSKLFTMNEMLLEVVVFIYYIGKLYRDRFVNVVTSPCHIRYQEHILDILCISLTKGLHIVERSDDYIDVFVM